MCCNANLIHLYGCGATSSGAGNESGEAGGDWVTQSSHGVCAGGRWAGDAQSSMRSLPERGFFGTPPRAVAVVVRPRAPPRAPPRARRLGRRRGRSGAGADDEADAALLRLRRRPLALLALLRRRRARGGWWSAKLSCTTRWRRGPRRRPPPGRAPRARRRLALAAAPSATFFAGILSMIGFSGLSNFFTVIDRSPVATTTAPP